MKAIHLLAFLYTPVDVFTFSQYMYVAFIHFEIEKKRKEKKRQPIYSKQVFGFKTTNTTKKKTPHI